MPLEGTAGVISEKSVLVGKTVWPKFWHHACIY